MTKTIISLTAIPPRFPHIGETLTSLLKQGSDIAAIELWLPRSYRRFAFDVDRDLPKVPAGVQIHIADHDYGPATKVLPSALRHRGKDVNILFCDDDKVYDPNWAARLVGAAKSRPGCCIVEEGSDVFECSDVAFRGKIQPRYPRRRKTLLYRLKRAASLGRWKSRKAEGSGYADILEGWGGVLVRPEFFGDEVFDIPDPLWMVDDIWLSGHLTVRNVPIWLHYGGPRVAGAKEEVSAAALRKQTVRGMDRKALNSACVRHYQDRYGIWRP
ncbi:MAG: glycosyltransferase family A protein [Pseudorhodobacter sp.]